MCHEVFSSVNVRGKGSSCGPPSSVNVRGKGSSCGLLCFYSPVAFTSCLLAPAQGKTHAMTGLGPVQTSNFTCAEHNARVKCM